MFLKTYFLPQVIVKDLTQEKFPAILRTWQDNLLQLSATETHLAFVYQGHPLLTHHPDGERYRLHPGMYFCLPGAGRIEGENSSGIVVTFPNYRGMFSLGGPIESTGRFAYIDGGTNSLLIPPIVLGDPCLNAMYFPAGIDQTLHTHPSYRIGIIVTGRGKLITPQISTILEPGTVFLIPANSLHKFRTYESSLSAVVFHPDSDIGFTHQDNPMLWRTTVEGTSAARLPQIQTKIPDD